ncbi:MAG TPA: sigma-70 family RNA polymerase sigma factor [Polyangia bacterium]
MADDDSEPDDQALVARFRRGDGAAFDALVRRYQRPIYWLARRYLGNDADAKDVAQRALVQAFVKLRQLRDAGSFRAWVYRTAANLALNVLRDRKPSAPLGDEVAAAPAREPLVEPMLEAETQRRLRDAVTRLPPQQRLVVELRIYEELPFAAVAEIAECSEDSAKVSFHHALKKLRVMMNEENEP